MKRHIYPSKNPYYQKIQDECNFVFLDERCFEQKPLWKTKDYQQTHLEIGCNAGHVLIPTAHLHPKQQFIGLEWKLKACFKAEQKIVKANISNTYILRNNAQYLRELFEDATFDSIACFFPDPWEKKSQQKERILTHDFFTTCHDLLKPSGTFHLKTDHDEYFSTTLHTIEQHPGPWNILELNRDLWQSHPEPHKLTQPTVTVFEKLFIKKNIPIKSIIIKKLA